MRALTDYDFARLAMFQSQDQGGLRLLSYRGKGLCVWYAEWARMRAVGLGPNLGRSRLFTAPVFETVDAAVAWVKDPANLLRVQRGILGRGEGSRVPLVKDPRASLAWAFVDKTGAVGRVTLGD